MKERYTKPVFAIERFSLSQSIARDCNNSLQFDNFTLCDLPCKYDMGGGVFLFVEQHGCDMFVGENSEYGCYNNPEENMLLFRS